jgi:tRNA A-37 threonylcarbamoyl transferase component Bud32
MTPREKPTMLQCPTCKQVLQPGVRFCPNDGTPLAETAAVSTVPTPAGARPASVQLQLPVLVGGRYRLEELRGGGGMAHVYKATDTTLERTVAVKLINPELRNDPEFDARFQREARVASQLADPHIVVVHDFGLDPVLGPFLVMEYLQGQSLRERLHTEGPLPLKAGLQLSAQLLLALIHAHGRSIVHRDIKPDNIFLLNQSGVRLHVRVLDFGIARIMRGDEPKAGGAEALTTPGAVLGTPRYMSPEQLAGQPVDARSDLYSAALVIFEALTGKLPYLGGDRLCQLCPEATPALQDLLEQCLRPDPNDRPANVVEVYLRLQELGKASGVLLLPPGTLDRLLAERKQDTDPNAQPTASYLPSTGRRWARQAVLGLGLAVLLAGAAFLFWKLFAPSGPATTGPETLLGVAIGDPQQEVVDRLHLTKGGPLNPWAGKRPEYLALALQKDDLHVPDADLPRLEVQRTADDRVCVLFLDGKVRAVVVRAPHHAATARGLKIGAGARDLFRLYEETPSAMSAEEPPTGDDAGGKNHVEIRKHDTLGIAFELQKGQIVALTLYPRSTP